MTKFFPIAIAWVLISSCHSPVQKTNPLRDKIQHIVSGKEATVGVSIIANDGKDTLSLHGDKHFPLQSVFKFHIALTVLSQIDQGNLSLEQEIELQKKDLLPGLWSPLREENPEGGSFPVSKLIQYSVSLSDNVGCDVLLRLVGGPKSVEEYLHQNGIRDIAIKWNEETQQSEWDFMFDNWTTPKAASETLKKFYKNTPKLLSEESYNFIWKTMKDTQTGENRLKGMLPKATVVAHKTGTSGTNDEGITGAVNDIGIMFLPNGKQVIISVFITDSKEDDETNEKIIAEIAKATWDYYTTTAKD